jgi:hypothetical protein
VKLPLVIAPLEALPGAVQRAYRAAGASDLRAAAVTGTCCGPPSWSPKADPVASQM